MVQLSSIYFMLRATATWVGSSEYNGRVMTRRPLFIVCLLFQREAVAQEKNVLDFVRTYGIMPEHIDGGE